LSQVSDAVVFVVSEETGTISMATEGHLFEMNLEDSPEAIERLPKNTPALDDVISLD
jgi:DNA integrity scanning protein DisA with diadenylate cyclase activity